MDLITHVLGKLSGFKLRHCGFPIGLTSVTMNTQSEVRILVRSAHSINKQLLQATICGNMILVNPNSLRRYFAIDLLVRFLAHLCVLKENSQRRDSFKKTGDDFRHPGDAVYKLVQLAIGARLVAVDEAAEILKVKLDVIFISYYAAPFDSTRKMLNWLSTRRGNVQHRYL